MNRKVAEGKRKQDAAGILDRRACLFRNLPAMLGNSLYAFISNFAYFIL